MADADPLASAQSLVERTYALFLEAPQRRDQLEAMAPSTLAGQVERDHGLGMTLAFEAGLRGPTGHKVKRVAYGFTVQVDGRQERRLSAEWDREATEAELEKVQRAQAAEKAAIKKPPVPAFGAAVDRYLKAKERKRSVEHDRRLLAALTAHFGAETPLAEITTGRISEYRDQALARRSPRGEGKNPIALATVDRYLAALRAVLRMAHREWELLPTLPRVLDLLERPAPHHQPGRGTSR